MARQSKSSKTKSPVAVSIGKVIRKHRIKLDLSQEKFAELVGLSKNYIGDLERGEKEPTISTLHKIGLKVGKSASSLIKDSGH